MLGFEWTHAMFMFYLWLCNALAVFIVFCQDGHVFMSFQARHMKSCHHPSVVSGSSLVSPRLLFPACTLFT